MVSQLIRLFTKNIKFINYLFGSMDSVCRYMRELQKILKEVLGSSPNNGLDHLVYECKTFNIHSVKNK